MPLPLLDALSAPLEALAGPSRSSDNDLASNVGGIWESAWSDYRNADKERGKEVDDKQIDVVKAVLEIVGRELTISKLQDGTVSQPARQEPELTSSYSSRLLKVRWRKDWHSKRNCNIAWTLR
jgi:hypothetical protein